MTRVIGRVFETILIGIILCFGLFLISMRVLFIPIFALVAAKICLIIHLMIAACVATTGSFILGKEFLPTIALATLCLTVAMHLVLAITVVSAFARERWKHGGDMYFYSPPLWSRLERLFYNLTWQILFPITYASELSSGRRIGFDY